VVVMLMTYLLGQFNPNLYRINTDIIGLIEAPRQSGSG
jgi:hypothetical protein